MDAMYTYSYGTGGWLVLQSIPLILSPETYLAVVRPFTESTQLECYLARSLGISLIPIGLLTILLTGSIPLTSSFADAADAPPAPGATDAASTAASTTTLETPRRVTRSTSSQSAVSTTPSVASSIPPTSPLTGKDLEDPKAPYAIPTMLFTSIMHAASAFGAYVLWSSMPAEGSGVFLGFCCMISSLLAGVGLICVGMGVSGVKKEVAEKVGME